MDDKVKIFLESGLLELYVYGELDASDELEVTDMIGNHPEVNAEYQLLQEQLEKTSFQQAKPAPLEARAQILESITKKENIKLESNRKTLYKWIAAASVLFGFACMGLFVKSNNSLSQSSEIIEEIKTDCEKRQETIQYQAELIAFLQSDQTSEFKLIGNQKAPAYKGIAFINSASNQMLFRTSQTEKLPKGKCLQLWGDIDGEMISVAVLSNTSPTDLISIDPRFESLNLTIESVTEDGKGQDHPDVSQLIASVLI